MNVGHTDLCALLGTNTSWENDLSSLVYCTTHRYTAQVHDEDLRTAGRLVKTASQTVAAPAPPDNVENPQLPSGQQLKEEKKFQNIFA